MGGYKAALLALAGVIAAGCHRESRPVDQRASKPETGPASVALTDFRPGAPVLVPTADPRSALYEGNAYHIAQGQRLFAWFNCTGCHANGGGGMGPALMDEKWRYGPAMEQIYLSIAQGRPNGMPAFQGKVEPQQIWQLAAFVRSLSGLADKIAAPSRLDGMRSTPPLNNMGPPPRTSGDPANVRTTG